MTAIVFDLETQPTKDLLIMDRLIADISPPSNYSKPETIAAWWAGEGELQKRKAVDATSLDGTFGSVYCIGYKLVDPMNPTAPQEPCKILCEADEALMLNQFNALFGDIEFGSPVTSAIGYNIIGFDLPFLFRRMAINNVPIHRRLKAIIKARPWDDVVFDVARQWQGYAAKMNKAADVAYAMGIPMKTGGISGKDVAEEIRSGRGKEVQDYCAEDVEATYQMWKRLV